MGRRATLLLALPLMICARATAPPPLLLNEMATMRQVRARSAARDPALAPVLASLALDAVALYAGNSSWVDGPGPWAVTDKVKWTSYVASSGDLHDYFSTAKYCWPCNTTCDRKLFPGKECEAWLSGRDYHPHSCDNQTGLPWLCHDGFANPINAYLDSGSWAEVVNAVPTLALSAFLTDNTQHGQRAASLARTWFLDPATAMRPNIQYSQEVPGLNNGTHGGIIDWSDHHKLLDILDALSLLRASPDPVVAAAWSATDEEQMVQWVSELSDWLKHSQHAREEARASNNHGTWFDVMALGLYVSTHGVHSARSFFGKRSVKFATEPASLTAGPLLRAGSNTLVRWKTRRRYAQMH